MCEVCERREARSELNEEDPCLDCVGEGEFIAHDHIAEKCTSCLGTGAGVVQRFVISTMRLHPAVPVEWMPAGFNYHA
jgi:DnaJ-class molecular chaperone